MANLGLVLLHPEPHEEHTCDVDIVAIHGLDTNSDRTWQAYRREGDPKSGLVHWLRDKDMLPKHIPKARIFAYGWNANTITGASGQYFYTHADTFLSRLAAHRLRRFQNNPIIFIASCYGGLILAKALIQASIRHNDYSHILDATSAIMFLGTPFRGSNGTTAAQTRVTVARAMGGDTNENLLKVLTREDGILEETRERFAELMLDHFDGSQRMVFFHETRPTEVAKAIIPQSYLEMSPWKSLSTFSKIMLVDRDSACIDTWPREAINKNHTMLNKFRGPEDGDFKVVLRWIYIFENYIRAQKMILKHYPPRVTGTRRRYRQVDYNGIYATPRDVPQKTAAVEDKHRKVKSEHIFT
ncbi:hypothetical protein F5Y19DRAFT_471874 [Xylariaceae sp. FL1651]|nr:hypothetical protein F5Y19DRAFT_471874 [Xylariaceae sp. FL1651]